MAGLLNSITGPEDLKKLSLDQLKELSADMRHLLQETVFQTGGEFANNLDTVFDSVDKSFRQPAIYIAAAIQPVCLRFGKRIWLIAAKCERFCCACCGRPGQ